MNDETYELASAFIDGEVTEAERARVLSDPDLLALVDELQAPSSLLRHIATSDDASRSAAINTAIDTAARQGQPATRWWNRPTVAAAAVVAVIAIGALGIGAMSRSASDSAQAPMDASTREESVDLKRSTDAAAAVPQAEPSSEQLDDRDFEAQEEAPMAESAMNDTSLADAPGDAVGADEGRAANATEARSFDAVATDAGSKLEPALNGSADLPAAAATITDLQLSGQLVAPTSDCTSEPMTALATYVWDDGRTADVVVAVDAQQNVVAYNADTCEVVADTDE